MKTFLCIVCCIAMNKLTDEAVENLPDEFLDKLMYNIMTDPINLSNGSDQYIDRSVLKYYYNIKGDHQNPFNRQPLQLQGRLVTDTDPPTDKVLQNKILKYINNPKNLKKTEENVMDVSVKTSHF